QSKPIIAKHVAEIVDKFYAHLLRYPPTRKFFLTSDGSIDRQYLELRMRHQANFWLRTADANFDDEYASYLDYVGRAHTSRGADPKIYIAERYVIGQVGFMSHAINEALSKELRHVDEDFELRAIEAWNKLMNIVLEMLARAYDHEREAETFDALVSVNEDEVQALSDEASRLETDKDQVVPRRAVTVARVQDIPDGERKLVNVDGLSIGVFHHDGNWYALRNSCLHRGGPVATGKLDCDTLTCPWHGFQYDVTTGRLLVDPRARLDTYPVMVECDEVRLLVPDLSTTSTAASALAPAPPLTAAPAMTTLQPHEFHVADVPPGRCKLVVLDEEYAVAVYNVGGTFFATQAECTHVGGPL
ncbi:MAG: Rieske 2Fe-2S domain-containing protein, partial [Chloroflexi bacterium]|nr:Rieske 2Fe-2S domain-containing protein [Chloroflexota bacterium]